MKTARLQIFVGVICAAAGLILAWRALDQTRTTHSPSPDPVPQHVSESFQNSVVGLISPTRDNTSSLLFEAHRTTLKAIGSDLLPTSAIQNDGVKDLAIAFRARLAALLLDDYDASIEDMIERGWPRWNDEIREAKRSQWEDRRPELSHTQIDPSSILVRKINPDAITNPGADLLGGYRRNCSQVIPLDSKKQPMTHLSQPDDGLHEIRIRAVRPNAKGRPVDVFLGYQFTWDKALRKWRWVRTCIYYSPNDEPFAAISPV